MTHDPMLDGITRYRPTVMHGGYFSGMEARDLGTFVLFSDLPALLAAAREDAVRDYAEAHYANKMQRGEERYEQGQRDEREAIDAEITADLTARIQREREDRDPDLLLGGIDYALQNVLRVIRARGES